MHLLLRTVGLPFGIALALWNHVRRTTTVIERSEHPGSWPDDGPPDVDPAVPRDGVQRPEDGAGPLFRRRYTARVRGGHLGFEELMARVQANPNVVVPAHIAKFEKTLGAAGVMRVGDEYRVRMPGPW